MPEKFLEGKIEQKEQPSKFNLLTNYEETVRAMAEIEGEAWLSGDQESKKTDLTTRGAIEHLKRLAGVDAEFRADGIEPEEYDSAVYSVYGNGGWSRWMIMRDGEVRFSKFHDPDKAKKAEAVGFRIFK
jgi:hypothetical protein